MGPDKKRNVYVFWIKMTVQKGRKVVQYFQANYKTLQKLKGDQLT